MSEENPVTESAKAVQEVAKATGQTVEALSDVSTFAGRYIQGTDRIISTMIQRELHFLSWKRGVRLVEKAKAFAEEYGIEMTPNRIPINLAVDLLREGSMEEDDNLQDRYAALLVNAASENSAVQIHRRHTNILSQLSTLEVKILDAAYWGHELVLKIDGIGYEELEDSRVVFDEATQRNVFKPHPEPSSQIVIAYENLGRLGLVERTIMYRKTVDADQWVSLTEIGRDFVRGCTVKKRCGDKTP